ncbi:hypothetical protein [Pantoea dispersa]|nr:hypothetical protein [Pantoea dispersa]
MLRQNHQAWRCALTPYGGSVTAQGSCQTIGKYGSSGIVAW